MSARPLRRRLPAIAFTLLASAAVLTGCGAQAGPVRADPATAAPAASCTPYVKYGYHPGKRVSFFSSTLDRDAELYRKSFLDFERCTGIAVDYEGSNDFEQALATRIKAGAPPDLALISQPGLLATLAHNGAVLPPPPAVVDLVKQNWSKDWQTYASVDGRVYAAPAGASVKSLVWYSPKFFALNHLQVPQTWADMMTLTKKLAGPGIKGVGSGFKPWCAGFASGAATGWPGTDWIEDLMLRTAGPDVYDEWVAHKIPFNDPAVRTAFDTAGTILRNEAYVNGGTPGGVKSIDTLTFQNGGVAILRNRCALHRQASFYAAQWPKGAEVSKNGDVFAFVLPPIDPARGKTVLGAGDFVAALSNRPEVQAFQTYLASGEWVTLRCSLGGFASANKGLNKGVITDEIQQLSVEALQAPGATFRFDGSDLMPAKVGTGTFWTGMVDWINGESTAAVTNKIEASWPTASTG